MLKKKIKKLLKGVVKIIVIGGFILIQFLGGSAKAMDIKPYELSEECIVYHDNKTVVIEAGHMGGKQGLDTGAIAIDGRYEADMNLELAKDIEKELEKQGINVEIIRDKDEFMSLGDKVWLTNKKAPDLSLQLHFNSALNKGATGSEIYYNTACYDKYGKPILDEFSNVLSDSLDITNRGAFKTPYYNKSIKSPSILLENCFISTKGDLEKYDNNKDKLVKNISNMVVKMLKGE